MTTIYRSRFFSLLGLIAMTVWLSGCGGETPRPQPVKEPVNQVPAIPVPNFNADSAYAFVQKQVDFGPRVPGTEAWAKTADYLEQKLSDYNFEVQVQEADVTVFTGAQVPMKNIIGRYKPEINNRIMLFAHWDTRPYADKDTERKNEPIDGANDGGSGVGVILEIARILATAEDQPRIGLDVIFFDVEDWGQTENALKAPDPKSYCLGSQYWGNNPPIANFRPRYGILLDMVGAKDARFSYEAYSMQYAPQVMQKVWKKAADLGYGATFLARNNGFSVLDDHIYVNQLAKIPSIDIIESNVATLGFGPYHHTHDDNMDIIDRATLKAVGQTVLAVIYSEN